ncbi:MAG: DUF5134 domain-containing protein [Ktedonobacteraceae bacterium]|nr:DUF5134 domain-containing protein [Ktedonobacteraceae bacterium]
MTGNSLLSPFWVFLCTVVALFSVLRLVCGRRCSSHVDAEHEIGHGMMAIGMALMLAPAGLFPPDLLWWNSFLFAATSLWWTSRLFVRKPVLALLSGKDATPTTIQSDGIQVLMHSGMCYLFLLMRSMVFSMTQPALSVTVIFFVAFALLTCFYGRETTKDLQAPQKDWLQCGAHLAHVCMSAMMCWMFLDMLIMVVSMKCTC